MVYLTSINLFVSSSKIKHMPRAVTIYGCFLALLLIGSCKQYEEYPVEPFIGYEGFTLLTSPQSGTTDRGVIKFSFTDGDGDLGFLASDTAQFHQYDLFVTYLECHNGVWDEIVLTTYNAGTQKMDTVNLHARLPYLTPSGNQKSIHGFIKDTLPVNNYQSIADTIKFKFFIKDRAQHQSNTLETEPIALLKTPISL